MTFQDPPLFVTAPYHHLYGSASIMTDAANDEQKAENDFSASLVSFPYEPYSIQVDFMRSLWQTIKKKHIGIYESPTGTV